MNSAIYLPAWTVAAMRELIDIQSHLSNGLYESPADLAACLNQTAEAFHLVLDPNDSEQPMLEPMKFLPYWPHEQSGVLPPIVDKFISTDEPLTANESALLAYYLQFWAYFDWQVAVPDDLIQLRSRFTQLVVDRGDRASIQQWLNEAILLGIDPL